MTVKITVIYDNRCDKSHLKEGWGFSALIEYEGSKILFDTGGDSPAFLFNAHALQLPFDQITHLAFSHKHWDHIAGFKDSSGDHTIRQFQEAYGADFLKVGTGTVLEL